MKTVRVLMALAFLASVWIVSIPYSAQALTIGNVAEVVQTNYCEDCFGVDQYNEAIIFQDIVGGDVFVYNPPPGVLDSGWFTQIVNDVFFDQDNNCINCTPDVDQVNDLVIFQDLEIAGSLQGPGPPILPSFDPTELGNYVDIVQYNDCINCEDVIQYNFAYIFQHIGLDDSFLALLNNYVPGADVLNLVDIIQENYCVICGDPVQENLFDITQEINVVPEPGTFLLLGTGLAGLLGLGRRRFCNGVVPPSAA